MGGGLNSGRSAGNTPNTNHEEIASEKDTHRQGNYSGFRPHSL